MSAQSLLPEVTTKQARVLRTPILDYALPNDHPTELLLKSYTSMQHLSTPQETICQFFLDIVKQWSPELVLYEFNNLFINAAKTGSSNPHQAIHQLISSANEQDFINTLKRCCYILLNNWVATRQYKYTQDLVKIFSNSAANARTSSGNLKTLNIWIKNFVNSQNYQDLKLFVAKYANWDKGHWKSRYTSYLLAPQYIDSNNSIEQRQAAKGLAKQLKDQFKFDLAMYTARSESAASRHRKPENPTALGDEALRLIKKVVAKRGNFSYANIANIFLKQTEGIKYNYFKQSLLKYLFYSSENYEFVESIKKQIGEKLEVAYEDYSDYTVNKSLILKSCNRLIDYLITEKNGEPSPLFMALASQGNALTLVMLLLKIILISPPTRTHLEVCIAKVIEYYEGYDQEECQWVINFLEILKITITIYTENVQYNLVNMKKANIAENSNVDENGYRIFSQTKLKRPQ
jgi:hypothetical protein